MKINRRIIGAFTAILLSLALTLPAAAAAIPSYKLERDDLVQRVWDAAVYGKISYTTYYNIGEVSCAAMQDAAYTAEGTGGKVLINFDTLTADNTVVARITMNPMLVKTAEGSFNFIIDTTAETNAAAKEKFETILNKPVAVMTCGQEEFGMSVVLAGKLDLTGINKEKLIAYSYNPEKKTYSLIANAKCTTDDKGFTYLQTKIGGTIIITSAD